MKICVVGTGYVGLVAATCLAETGHDVVGVDVDVRKVEMLRGGQSPIYEPGLEELLSRNQGEGRLAFTTDLKEAVEGSELVYIAVSTPEAPDGSADLRALRSVAADVGRMLNGYKVIVIKSTVPVGTNEEVAGIVAGLTHHPFDVASNPEFLKEGTAINDFMKPDRIVLGTSSERAREILRYVYEPLVRTENPIIFMDPRSAEMTKYACNAFLATRISFMNEMARLCEVMGADIDAVRKGMGSDTRIGYRFLFPGVGYGGSCFPKDVQALMFMGRQAGLGMKIISSADEVNDEQKHVMGAKIVRLFGEDLTGKVFALWGLAFKPGTDDMREAPSLTIIEDILARGGTVHAYDPVAMEEARRHFGDRITLCRSNYEALVGADALVIVTEWSEFRRPDLQRIRDTLRGDVVLDGRNILDPHTVMAAGLRYGCIGRGVVDVASQRAV